MNDPLGLRRERRVLRGQRAGGQIEIEMIADAAEQEDVDVVGLSILSGAHMTLLPRLVEMIRGRGMDDILIAAGGIIPDADIGPLKKAGIAEIFGPGTRIGDIARYFREHARQRT